MKPTVDLLSETIEVRMQWNDIFRVMKAKTKSKQKLSTIILYSEKLFFKMKTK